MLKKLGLFALGSMCLVALALGVAYLVTAPDAPAPSSPSASWLMPGKFEVGQADFTFVDTSRPTAQNNDYSGAPNRTLKTSLWFPTNSAGTHPLVIYSHGFISNRNGGDYLAKHLASYGYVVAAADYPLTHGDAPGGPNASDVTNQPADVSFLIDSVMALDDLERPFSGTIDPLRVGAAGLSLGGLTTTLATYHPRLRDERITAAISIAGPASMFTERFFANSPAPFLMIAGTIDAIVDYQANAVPIPQLKSGAVLLSIENASHTAFVSIAEPYLRFMNNPDSLGCDSVSANIDEDMEAENPFASIGGAADGVEFRSDLPPLCSVLPLPESLHPGRQQKITQAAVHSFFESIFAQRSGARRQARSVLIDNIPQDFPEASISL